MSVVKHLKGSLMQLSDMQNQALNAVKEWYKTPSKRFALAGYAGTGKSTIAGEIERDLGIKVVYVTFTGKAALVLKKKGLPATTIHRAIYNHDGEDENGDPVFSLGQGLSIKTADLVVVDEYSMLNDDLVNDLEYHANKVLYLGDPFQLPPVGGSCPITYDFILTEVHRQALDSNILRFATDVREGRQLQHCEYDDFVYQPMRNINPDEFMTTDQIIVGMNNTRYKWNKHMRNRIYGEAADHNTIMTGEKLICLRNNYRNGLLNGMFAEVINAVECQYTWDFMIRTDQEKIIEVEAYKQYFKGDKPYDKIPNVDHFDYGHVITCHKSQGSEWDNVLIFNEPVGQGVDRQKWLYTSLTRGKERVVCIG